MQPDRPSPDGSPAGRAQTEVRQAEPSRKSGRPSPPGSPAGRAQPEARQAEPRWEPGRLSPAGSPTGQAQTGARQAEPRREPDRLSPAGSPAGRAQTGARQAEPTITPDSGRTNSLNSRDSTSWQGSHMTVYLASFRFSGLNIQQQIHCHTLALPLLELRSHIRSKDPCEIINFRGNAAIGGGLLFRSPSAYCISSSLPWSRVPSR